MTFNYDIAIYIITTTLLNLIDIFLFLFKNIVRTCWAVSVLFWVIAVYGLPASSFNENEVTIIDSFFRVSYGALHRSAWAVAIGWLIFACIHDYGGRFLLSISFSKEN